MVSFSISGRFGNVDNFTHLNKYFPTFFTPFIPASKKINQYCMICIWLKRTANTISTRQFKVENGGLFPWRRGGTCTSSAPPTAWTSSTPPSCAPVRRRIIHANPTPCGPLLTGTTERGESCTVQKEIMQIYLKIGRLAICSTNSVCVPNNLSEIREPPPLANHTGSDVRTRQKKYRIVGVSTR